jgi:CRISPR system Cascade subunit CasD
MRWLRLVLEAPMSAFGGVVVDGRGVTRDQPALSAITGLLANALGYDRTETGRLAALQSRLLLASAYRAGDGVLMTDFQTAQLAKNDKGWTRWGVEGRDGGAKTYDSPALTYRDYHADRQTICVVGLKGDGDPDLDALAAALDRPERPLFIGRKSCLPSRPIRGGMIEAADALEALRASLTGPGDWRVSLPKGQGAPDQAREVRIPDLRDWTAGLHSGDRRIIEGKISMEATA